MAKSCWGYGGRNENWSKSKEEAIELGFDGYNDGTTCQKGHTGLKNLKGICVSCIAETARKRKSTRKNSEDYFSRL